MSRVRGLMNPVTRRQWTEALRSGRYKQTTGQLFKPDKPGREGGYCCLGVLADLAGGEVVHGKRNLDRRPPGWGDAVEFKFQNGETAHAFIPEELAEMVGVEDQTVLSRLNDTGSSFEQIADYIDRLPLRSARPY